MNNKIITIGVLCEKCDSRVALVPSEIKRLRKSNNYNVLVESNVDDSGYFSNNQYEEVGAIIGKRENIIKNSDIFVFISKVDESTFNEISLNANNDKKLIIAPFDNATVNIKNQNIICVAMEKIPRLHSAVQSMDSLSSQTSIAGYKAVLMAANESPKLFPMLITAAGTVHPVKVLILGAGVAGLQAIGTAKRLGAVVTAYDVRNEAREEISSMGAKFLELDNDFSSSGEGGYAKRLDDSKQKEQQNLIDNAIKDFDVIITTAKTFGAKPPVLVTENGIKQMKAGSVIVDLASCELGGNVTISEPKKTITTDNGVKVIGFGDAAQTAPITSSNLYSRNISEVIKHFTNENGIKIDTEDIIQKAMVLSQGE